MFRELGYGVRLFFSAAAGALVAMFFFLPTVRGGTQESQVQHDAAVIVLGAICGAISWLTYRYTHFPPRADK